MCSQIVTSNRKERGVRNSVKVALDENSLNIVPVVRLTVRVPKRTESIVIIVVIFRQNNWW